MAKVFALFCAFDAARLLIVSLGLIRTPLTSLSNMDPAVFSFLIKAEPRGKEGKTHLIIRECPHADVNVYRSLEMMLSETPGVPAAGVLRTRGSLASTQHYHLHFKTEAGFLLTSSIDYLISVMKRREEGEKSNTCTFQEVLISSLWKTHVLLLSRCLNAFKTCAEQKRD